MGALLRRKRDNPTTGMKQSQNIHPIILPTSSSKIANVKRIKIWRLLLMAFVFQILVVCKFDRNTTSTDIITSPTSPPRWAYVFLMAACDPENPWYRGTLYNILVATYSLKYYGKGQDRTRSNSKADVIVLVQMAFETAQEVLPATDVQLLQKMGIQIRYIPKPKTQPNFYSLVMEKFRILELTEYSRVTFLDGDILPLCNLDYVMELSQSGVLQENVLHAMYLDPVNAGFFVLTPGMDKYRQVMDIVHRVSPTGELPPPRFDARKGWGNHTLGNYRLWDGQEFKSADWTFYCAQADQGLLLHYTKFVLQSVSIIIGDEMEHTIKANGNGNGNGTMVVTTTRTPNFLLNYSCLPPGNNTGTFASNQSPMAASLPFYRDFHHSVGFSKFWEQSLPVAADDKVVFRKQTRTHVASSKHY
jgi:hypothetical protein